MTKFLGAFCVWAVPTAAFRFKDVCSATINLAGRRQLSWPLVEANPDERARGHKRRAHPTLLRLGERKFSEGGLFFPAYAFRFVQFSRVGTENVPTLHPEQELQ